MVKISYCSCRDSGSAPSTYTVVQGSPTLLASMHTRYTRSAYTSMKANIHTRKIKINKSLIYMYVYIYICINKNSGSSMLSET